MDYSSRKGVWGWMFFDWAGQPFQMLMTVIVFPPLFASVMASDAAEGQAIWGMVLGTAGLLVAILSPTMGAIVDSVGPRKPWIFVFSVLLVVPSFLLTFLATGPDNLLLTSLLIVLAIIGFEITTVFTNAMMPTLVPRDRLGRLSGNGWAMGNVAGVLSLVLMLGLLIPGESGRTVFGVEPLFGFRSGTGDAERSAGAVSALWYLVFIIPLFLFTPDVARRGRVSGAFTSGMNGLFQTIRTLRSKNRNLFVFIVSSMLFRDAILALIGVVGILLSGVLGWSTAKIGLFGLIFSISGALGGWLGGKCDDWFGPMRVVRFSLGGLVLLTATMPGLSPDTLFYVSIAHLDNPAAIVDPAAMVYGFFAGIFGGSLQASARTLVVDFARGERLTEAFGIYSFAGRATSFVGPYLVGTVTAITGSQVMGLIPVSLLFIAGFVALSFIDKEDAETSATFLGVHAR